MSWLVVANLLGGAALFLLGMKWLSGALREAAGERLRRMLTAATGSRWRGLLLGSSVGFLAHSSSAVAMTVGFVHAGLLSLAAALPVLFGANVGTTLSMQLISFRLTDYALAAVAVGGALYLISEHGRARTLGQAVLGFGLLFLGMKISGEAIAPHRDAIEPFLAKIDGRTALGMITGIGIAALATIVVQSSGAVIGMTFVLAGSGAFTALSQTYPIVLGAHIGTTTTGLLASLGTSNEARRAAVANLLFNVFNAVGGAIAAPLLIPLLEQTGGDVVRQTANTHTAIMLLAAAALLPFTTPLAAGLRRVWRGRDEEGAASFLDPALRRTPEDALAATMRELGRCAGICAQSYALVNRSFLSGDRRAWRRVRRNESAVDEIKSSVRSYLGSLAQGYLSRRQALLAQSLNRCAVELERIADHIESLGELAGGRENLSRLDERIAGSIAQLSDLAREAIEKLAASFDPDADNFEASSWAILEARKSYVRESAAVKSDVTKQLSRHEVPAHLALNFSEYAAALDRIARHCAVIAQEQRQPHFTIKQRKLGHLAGPQAPRVEEEDDDE